MTHPTLKFISGFFLLIVIIAAIATFASPLRRAELADIGAYLDRPLFARDAMPLTAQFSYLSRNRFIDDLSSGAEAALVWDITGSRALYAKESHTRRPIASITKLVTAAVVMDSVSLQDPVRISQGAVEINGDAGGLQPGEILEVETLLHATLLESSNDAAYALAQHIGGMYTDASENDSRAIFVSLMNQKAREIGLLNSNFQDPAGLIDEGAYSTAEDLARLLTYLRTEERYQGLWEILSRPQIDTLSGDGLLYHEFVNNNPFLQELAGVIGGKTGYTSAAGESMVLLARSPDNSRELAYIILGSTDRFSEMRNLINWTQSAYIWEKLPSR